MQLKDETICYTNNLFGLLYNNVHFVHQNIIRGSNKGWNVFYHFIGAAPGSTDLGFMLQRMLKEVKYVVSRSIL